MQLFFLLPAVACLGHAESEGRVCCDCLLSWSTCCALLAHTGNKQDGRGGSDGRAGGNNTGTGAREHAHELLFVCSFFFSVACCGLRKHAESC